MNTATESEKNALAPGVPQPKTKRVKNARPAKKAGARSRQLAGTEQTALTVHRG